MCGGGFLGLSPKTATAKAVKMPKAEIPAAPAPSRKQDSGAIVAIGDNESEYSDARRRAAMRNSSRTGGSALGAFGSSIL